MKVFIYARSKEHAPNGGDVTLPIAEYDQHDGSLKDALLRFCRDFDVPYEKATVRFRPSKADPYEMRKQLQDHHKIVIW